MQNYLKNLKIINNRKLTKYKKSLKKQSKIEVQAILLCHEI